MGAAPPTPTSEIHNLDLPPSFQILDPPMNMSVALLNDVCIPGSSEMESSAGCFKVDYWFTTVVSMNNQCKDGSLLATKLLLSVLA